MNKSGGNGNSNQRLGQNAPHRTSSNTGYETHDTTIRGRDYSERQEQLSASPKIKIFGQQVYKTERIDERERQELHKQYGHDPLLLIFNSRSCDKLKECIAWGYKTRQNHVEQGGILLGHVKQYQREIFSFVDDCVLANTRGSSAFVEFTPEMWSSMQQGLDSLNAQRGNDNQMAIIGWFHTHPNGLSVFMSGTDQDTQDKNFSQDWQVSVVLNPQKMKLRAFFGKEIRDGRIVGWNDKTLQRSQMREEEIPYPKPSITGNSAIDDEIARYEVKISECESKIAEYKQQIVELKKNARRFVLAGLLLVVIFFATGLCVGNFLNKAPTPIATSEPSTIQTPETVLPVPKSASVVMFSIISEKWTSNNDSPYCDVLVEGKTADGVSYNSTHRIKCKNDESFIELEAGTYTITLVDLPELTGGLIFKDIIPINLSIDGTTPKLITIELETMTKEVTTPAATSEAEDNEISITTTQPESSQTLMPSTSEQDGD